VWYEPSFAASAVHTLVIALELLYLLFVTLGLLVIWENPKFYPSKAFLH